MAAGLVAALQADPQLLAQLDRLVWAYWLTAAATLLIALIAVGAALMGLQTMRRVAHLLETADRMTDQIAPHAKPLLERAEQITEEVGRMAHRASSEYEALHETLHRANEGLRALVEEAEARARRFGAVVELVQTEAEDVLVDAASTARGVQATARALRGEAGVSAGPERARIGTDSGGRNG
jgi:methyl-accepting chemotaxis protein